MDKQLDILNHTVEVHFFEVNHLHINSILFKVPESILMKISTYGKFKKREVRDFFKRNVFNLQQWKCLLLEYMKCAAINSVVVGETVESSPEHNNETDCSETSYNLVNQALVETTRNVTLVFSELDTETDCGETSNILVNPVLNENGLVPEKITLIFLKPSAEQSVGDNRNIHKSEINPNHNIPYEEPIILTNEGRQQSNAIKEYGSDKCSISSLKTDCSETSNNLVNQALVEQNEIQRNVTLVFSETDTKQRIGDNSNIQNVANKPQSNAIKEYGSDKCSISSLKTDCSKTSNNLVNQASEQSVDGNRNIQMVKSKPDQNIQDEKLIITTRESRQENVVEKTKTIKKLSKKKKFRNFLMRVLTFGCVRK